MTTEEQAELRKTLTALDGLLTRLMPEDATKLALDPRRQQAAALMLGSIALAQDLLKRAMELCESMPHASNGKRRLVGWGAGGRLGEFVLKQLAKAPEHSMQRNELFHAAMKAHVSTGTGTYTAILRLQELGKVKIDKDSRVWLIAG